MGYVAFVPQRDVLKGRLRIGANHSRQAPNLLARHRVPLVWHGGRAFLAGSKGFLSLTDLSPLQMADFQGDLLKRGSDQGQSGHVFGMKIAGNYLGRDGGWPQTQPSADSLLG